MGELERRCAHSSTAATAGASSGTTPDSPGRSAWLATGYEDVRAALAERTS
ncbi:predicted protein [Streptomyces viridochromogenes DSM 40736]|uniref:Predicted protein n=1 Tax=Streptomyces viridochromogenes (strain DSM 40736 / JCM 4977 / BCRC 1201 / Tue 494) TaxID=591159 RepID=D9X0Y7_STRVT|nr:predicted protein [Streptomyces viridochromogenes DSM 40736]